MEYLRDMLSILFVLAMLVLVLLLAYFTTKWLGGKMAAQSSSRLIKIIDRTSLGREGALLIVRVADHTMLVGITENAIEKLCDLDGLEALEATEPPQALPFSAMLLDSMKGLKLGGRSKKEDDNQ